MGVHAYSTRRRMECIYDGQIQHKKSASGNARSKGGGRNARGDGRNKMWSGVEMVSTTTTELVASGTSYSVGDAKCNSSFQDPLPTSDGEHKHHCIKPIRFNGASDCTCDLVIRDNVGISLEEKKQNVAKNAFPTRLHQQPVEAPPLTGFCPPMVCSLGSASPSSTSVANGAALRCP